MSNQHLVIFGVSLVFSLFVIAQAVQGPLKVSLYYESLCPDCIGFVAKELYPTVKTDIGDYLELDLVPFGNARAYNRSGHWKFTCQHGPSECYGNKIQSCALADFPRNQSVPFIGCVMTTRYPSYDPCLQKCAEKTGLPWSNLTDCITSGRGDDLLAENGRRTHDVIPPIRYVPTIIFNDTFNETLQHDAERDFMGTVCKILDSEPKACKTGFEIFNDVVNSIILI